MTTLNECTMFKYNSPENSKKLIFSYSGDELNESDSFEEADLDDKYIEKSKKVQKLINHIHRKIILNNKISQI